METHEHDPTTRPDQDRWNTFHDELGDLGERLKNTYRQVAAEGGPSEDEIRDALVTLAGAWSQVADSVTTALQDPEVRERLQAAGASFASALGETISGLGAELGKDEEE